jgi:hypothetical protein
MGGKKRERERAQLRLLVCENNENDSWLSRVNEKDFALWQTAAAAAVMMEGGKGKKRDRVGRVSARMWALCEMKM